MAQSVNRRLPRPQAKVAAIPTYSRAAGLESVSWIASSNESPMAPSPRVVEAVAGAAAEGNRYPPMFGDGLIAALGRRYGFGAEQIVVGGGSLSILQLALSAFAGPGAEVVYAWRSYEAYPIAVRVSGAESVEVPLTEDHVHDLDAMAAATTDATSAVIVCNPNNPTGTTVPIEEIRRFLQRIDSRILVILDEAYREFSDAAGDGLDLVEEFPNLIVMRTFSKAYGLAGVRAGYAIGSAEIVESLRKVAPPFGLSRLAEAAAVAALDDVAHMNRIVTTITAERDRLLGGLRERGVQVPASRSNFVWIPTATHGPAIVAGCLDRRVSVRAFEGEGVRVTAGEPEVTDAILEAVDSLPDLAAH